MRQPYTWSDPRRLAPRVGVESLCNEIVNGQERPVLALDVSPTGIRVERPYLGGGSPRDVQLEIEIPEVDEILWARGAVRFDCIRRAPAGSATWPGGLLRTTGIRLVAAAVRDLRLLREYVMETRRRLRAAEELDDDLSLAGASCYLRG